MQKRKAESCRYAAVAAIIRHRNYDLRRSLAESLRRLRRPKSLAELNIARAAPATPTAPLKLALPTQARILGLDPGSQCTGYAVVEIAARVTYVTSGSIRPRASSFAERLQEIFVGVDRLTSEYRPDEVAIERIFMHRNADSALKLGQARGAALSGTFALRPRVFEYAPREVKLAVVGTGAAQKEQVQLMVRSLLNLSGRLGADAADALAIALCHAHSRNLNSQLRSLAVAASGGAQ
jgi:crossover junction endodeoxyribonuclease RuvC